MDTTTQTGRVDAVAPVFDAGAALVSTATLQTMDVLEAIDEGFAICDEHDRLIVANRVYKDIFAGIIDLIKPGVPFESLIRAAAQRGQNVESLIDAEAWVQGRMVRHRAASGVYEHKFADGRWIQVRERRNALGHVIGTYTDVTPLIRRTEELGRARDSLQALSKRMQAMIEASSDWIWARDTDGVVTCELEGAGALGDFDPAPHIELALSNCMDRCPLPPDEPCDADWASVRGLRHYVQLPSGAPLFLSINGKGVFNDAGELEGWVGTATDVTEKTRIQQEAAHHTAVLEGVLDCIPQAVLVYSSALNVVTLSRQSSEILGLSLQPGDPVQRLGDALGPLPLQRIVDWARTRNDEVLELGDVLTRAGATLVARANGMSTGGFVITFTDVSEQRKAALMAHQSQKLVALGQLSGGVAHEFNNLLTSIGGFSRMAIQHAADAETVVDCLGEVVTAADRAAALTRQMLTFSRKDRFEEKVIPAADVVQSLGKLMKPLLPETVAFEVVVDDARSCVKVDEAQFSQALMNLVLNARDAMPQGGRVVLRLSLDPTPQAQGPGPWVCISVADNGTGIEPQHLSSIFDPFFTTKDPGKGTGLGLSVVHGIVQRFGGTITVNSTLGVGTTFLLRVPQAAVEMPELPLSDTALYPVLLDDGGGRTILVIEDEPTVRALVVRTLKSKNYRLLVASDHSSALDVLSRCDMPPALLLSDVVLPHKSGPEIASELRQRFPDMKVLFMSGYIAPNIDEKGLIQAQEPVLSKPFAPDLLCQWVSERLGVEQAQVATQPMGETA